MFVSSESVTRIHTHGWLQTAKKNNFKACHFKFPVMLKALGSNEIQYLLFLASLHPQNAGQSLAFHSLKTAQKKPFQVK